MATKREQLDEYLSKTLDDARLSRSERKALRQVIDEAGLSDDDRRYMRHRVFQLARSGGDNSEAREARLIDWIEDAVKLFAPESAGKGGIRAPEVLFSPGDRCKNRIISLFRTAQKSADVCVFTITDNDISDEIVRAHKRGIAVRIVSDNDKAEDRGSDVDRLDRKGVPVRVDRSEHHMHHKFAVFDGATAVTGSYNWTRSAAAHNRENLLITTEPAAIKQFVDEFERLWRELA